MASYFANLQPRLLTKIRSCDWPALDGIIFVNIFPSNLMYDFSWLATYYTSLLPDKHSVPDVFAETNILLHFFNQHREGANCLQQILKQISYSVNIKLYIYIYWEPKPKSCNRGRKLQTRALILSYASLRLSYTSLSLILISKSFSLEFRLKFDSRRAGTYCWMLEVY